MDEEDFILIAAEGRSDAKMISDLLSDKFGSILISVGIEGTKEVFSERKPRVLILAFPNIKRAEECYLQIFRDDPKAHSFQHQAIVLCSKENIWSAYELCKADFFDDYVLFWPITYDAPRLEMVVHKALREEGHGVGGPDRSDFAKPCKKIGSVENLIGNYRQQGDQYLDDASNSIYQVEQSLAVALDHLLKKAQSRDGETNSQHEMAEDILKLKEHELIDRFQGAKQSIGPLRNWLSSIDKEFDPLINVLNNLKSLTRQISPVVMFVDDDEFQHKLLKQVLKDSGLKIICFDSGSKALAALRNNKPDIILMDFNMPDINGIELTRRLKSADTCRDIPIVLVTGHSERAVVVGSLQAGAVDFVVKPFVRETLMAKINKYVTGA
ncbi:response regulator [Marinobacterium jannaschii]|uniref:response regulator n=1 Tax=Marinobacterium jannaschii TaxID=64970 RepID=UPI0006851B57|nr:response regulator [Marinobacterium jannaschii]